jgi:tetratricopeptide (TPR) repeat protein
VAGELDGPNAGREFGDVLRAATVDELARLLRQLRRREARRRGGPQLTYRELAAKTGWSLGIIGEYLSGKILPPTDRFDELIRLFGVTSTEQGALATARDRVEERRRSTPATVGVPAPRWPVPRQLPADVPGFTGRVASLATLDALLATGVPTPAVLISAVSGTAGVGKTALAIRWAHRVADRFSDGQLYVNLRGYDPSGSAMSPGEALRGFLDALHVPARRIPTGMSAQTGLYRSLLAGKRMLIVLDNARDADQVRPLLPGGSGCLALITSRNQLISLIALENARPLVLDLLTDVEAVEFLRHRIGPDRVTAEPDPVGAIITACAGLPLALAIVAARAAADPGLPLGELAGELSRARNLDAFDGGDATADVRAVFSWSYRTLGPAAARLFRLLGLHPGPDIAASAAASLAGLPLEQVRQLLAELSRAHLVTEPSPDRFTLHDLLRAYATELAESIEPEAERRAAIHRLLDHYLHTAFTAAMLLDPHRVPITLAPAQPGVTVNDLGDHQQAQTWFGTEHPALLAAVRRAADANLGTHAWQLSWALTDFLDRRGYWHDLAAIHHSVASVTRRSADRLGQAWAHRGIGLARTQLGQDDPYPELQRALDLFAELGEHSGQASTHHLVAWVCERQGRQEEALSHAQHSLRLYRIAGHQPGEASALNNIGWYHAQLGRYEHAVTRCAQALALHRRSGNRPGQASTLDSLGYAHHFLGRYPQAIACFQQALEVFREIGDRYEEAATLDHLGDTEKAAGDLDAARAAWQRSLDILDELDHPGARDVRAKLELPI